MNEVGADQPTYELPSGLEFTSVKGVVDGVLIISGSVRDAQVKAKSVVVNLGGSVTRSDIEADVVVIQGKASDTKMTGKSFVATGTAFLQDVSVQFQGPAGISIDKEAKLDGKVDIVVATKRPFNEAPAPSEGPGNSTVHHEAEPTQDVDDHEITIGDEG